MHSTETTLSHKVSVRKHTTRDTQPQQQSIKRVGNVIFGYALHVIFNASMSFSFDTHKFASYRILTFMMCASHVIYYIRCCVIRSIGVMDILLFLLLVPLLFIIIVALDSQLHRYTDTHSIDRLCHVLTFTAFDAFVNALFLSE